jgi:predicted nucleic acid-binding protein
MPADAFVDTNVLLYSVSNSEDEAGKRAAARQVLARSGWGLSVQVLEELYVNVVRPPRCAMSHADAVAAIRELLRRPTVATDVPLVLAGLRLKERFQLSYWDAAIIAAARALGAETLYSEDLCHGQDYEGVRVVNPFFSR